MKKQKMDFLVSTVGGDKLAVDLRRDVEDRPLA